MSNSNYGNIIKFNRKTPSNLLLLFVVLLCLCYAPLSAQKSPQENYYSFSDKHWEVEIPLWIPGFRGQMAYGSFSSSASNSTAEKEFNRINKDGGLEFYFMGGLSVKYGKIWGQLDAFSGQVGTAFTYNRLVRENLEDIVDITIKGTIPRLNLGYTIWKKTKGDHFKLEIIPHLGIRYININLTTDVFDNSEIIDVRPEWFQPIAGLYIPLSYKRFRLELQGDIGGDSTKNSWSVNNRFKYRFSRLMEVQLGWSILGLKYNESLSGQNLDFNIRMFGPTAGLGFWF
ncbi:hypothetical protein [Eudoraea chungangensis]|uniref:hypothetical protein n=1 Tax=Eudoraea chungangensis TaxID=1481905 RepID=UPI0023EB24EC|nr:hypothetical protein [Eudoraea chungangensis]